MVTNMEEELFPMGEALRGGTLMNEGLKGLVSAGSEFYQNSIKDINAGIDKAAEMGQELGKAAFDGLSYMSSVVMRETGIGHLMENGPIELDTSQPTILTVEAPQPIDPSYDGPKANVSVEEPKSPNTTILTVEAPEGMPKSDGPRATVDIDGSDIGFIREIGDTASEMSHTGGALKSAFDGIAKAAEINARDASEHTPAMGPQLDAALRQMTM